LIVGNGGRLYDLDLLDKGNILMKCSKPLLFAALFIFAPWPSAFCAEPAAHNYAKWEKEIAAFEQSDRATPPPKGALLFIGSSTIRRWTTLARDFPQYSVINRGFGGSEITDAAHFAPRIIFPYAPRAIYLRSGGNDLCNGKTVEQVFADFKEFVAIVRAKLPDTDIIFISLSPSIARWKQADKEKAVNALIADHIKGKARLRYIETYDMVLGSDGQPRAELFAGDKLHFNSDGYKLLAALVGPDLPRSCESNDVPQAVATTAPQSSH
jgi:lysophospholipase L1-like esterase